MPLLNLYPRLHVAEVIDPSNADNIIRFKYLFPVPHATYRELLPIFMKFIPLKEKFPECKSATDFLKISDTERASLIADFTEITDMLRETIFGTLIFDSDGQPPTKEDVENITMEQILTIFFRVQDTFKERSVSKEESFRDARSSLPRKTQA